MGIAFLLTSRISFARSSVLSAQLWLLQMAERLHRQCQDFLLSQLPAAARPAALAAAGQGSNLYHDTSDTVAELSADAYDEEDTIMHEDNGSCILLESGASVARNASNLCRPPCDDCMQSLCSRHSQLRG